MFLLVLVALAPPQERCGSHVGAARLETGAMAADEFRGRAPSCVRSELKRE